MPTWDPALYLKYAGERTRPASDLIAHVVLDAPARIVDLGCGPGNSTELLRRRWPDAAITGVDTSAEMLSAAERRLPGVRWVEADLARWVPDAPPDLIFANASLHWVRDHVHLLPRLLAQLAGGGVLAFQVPSHRVSPLHRELRRIARLPEWRQALRAADRAMTAGTPAFYYDVLRPHVATLDIWETEYEHVLRDVAAIVEWMRGTGLRPYLEALDSDEQRRKFEAELLSALPARYPPRVDGAVLFPFRRVFVVAVMPD